MATILSTKNIEKLLTYFEKELAMPKESSSGTKLSTRYKAVELALKGSTDASTQELKRLFDNSPVIKEIKSMAEAAAVRRLEVSALPTLLIGFKSKVVHRFLMYFEGKLGLPGASYRGTPSDKEMLGSRYRAVERALNVTSADKNYLKELFDNSPQVIAKIIADVKRKKGELMQKPSNIVVAVEKPPVEISYALQIVIPTEKITERNPQVIERVWGAKADTTARLNLCKGEKKRKRDTEASQVNALSGNSLPADDVIRVEKRQRVDDYTI